MILTNQDVEELRQIHHEVTGEWVTMEEAREMGENLVRLGMVLIGYPKYINHGDTEQS